jgi:hypothetical protein
MEGAPRSVHANRYPPDRLARDEAARIYASIGTLYEDASTSDSVFGSPLGPIEGTGARTFLPQFVYFAPASTVDPVRIGVFSGLSREDLKGSWALIDWIKALLVRPDIGHGVSVSVFPVVNLTGIQEGMEGAGLQASDWRGSRIPEIRLIADNARIRSYQGFIRIESSRDSVPKVVVRTAVNRRTHGSLAEIYDSSDFEPWETCFESLGPNSRLLGPLSLARELDTGLFEVVISLPAAWPQASWNSKLLPLLGRLVASYRTFFSYGGEL